MRLPASVSARRALKNAQRSLSRTSAMYSLSSSCSARSGPLGSTLNPSRPFGANSSRPMSLPADERHELQERHARVAPDADEVVERFDLAVADQHEEPIRLERLDRAFNLLVDVD